MTRCGRLLVLALAAPAGAAAGSSRRSLVRACRLAMSPPCARWSNARSPSRPPRRMARARCIGRPRRATRRARLLIRAGADVNAANRYGVTPLSLAARAAATTIVQALLDRGRQRQDRRRQPARGADAADARGRAPATSPAMKRSLAAGSNVNATRDAHGTTAVVWAAVAQPRRGRARCWPKPAPT